MHTKKIKGIPHLSLPHELSSSHLIQGSVNYSPQSKYSQPPASVNKVFWSRDTRIHLHGYFCATMESWVVVTGRVWPAEPRKFTIWPSYRECFSTPV